MLDRSEPYRMQVAINQIAVSQIERWGPHNAMNHLIRVVEKPLVVRTHSCAVGNDQGSLS